jgi:hypothetical protein
MSSQQPQPPIPIQDSQEPSEEGKHLVTLFTDMESKQLDFLDAAGKSIIERVSALLAVLFAVTAFSNNFPPAYLKGNVTAKVLVIVTLVLYLVALGAGMWGIQPRYYKRYTYNVSGLGRELEKITQHKMLWLRVAGVLFALGTVTLAILIITIIWAL